MKQKITIEKTKELENEVLTIKKFSLMKKHLFTLVMMLALFAFAGTSAWAQTSLPAAGTYTLGSQSNAQVYLNGGSGVLSITSTGATNTSVSWTMYDADDNSVVTATNDPVANPTAVLDLRTNAAWTVTQTTASYYFQFTDNAAGTYYVELTVTNTDHSCAETKRRFYIQVFGFDVEVYASNGSGVLATPAELADCSGNDYDAFMNDVLESSTAATPRTDLWNTATTPVPADGTLGAAYGNKEFQRYYTARVSFSGVAATFDPATLNINYATLDVQVTGTNMGDGDVTEINDVAILQTEDSDNITVSSVAGAGNTFLFTFPVTFADRWGVDLDPYAIVTNMILFTATDTKLGEEPVGKEDTNNSTAFDNNRSGAFTIYGKPTTTRITGN